MKPGDKVRIKVNGVTGVLWHRTTCEGHYGWRLLILDGPSCGCNATHREVDLEPLASSDERRFELAKTVMEAFLHAELSLTNRCDGLLPPVDEMREDLRYCWKVADIMLEEEHAKGEDDD